jgi:ribose transport system substrate-binding protein
MKLKSRKVISLFLCLAMILALALTGCSNSSSGDAQSPAPSGSSAPSGSENTPSGGEDSDITIGVSIWGTSDSLGSSCKRMLDAAAETLGITLIYDEQEHVSEKVVSGVENLCAAGVDGIIICNSADSEMSSVIRTCEDYGVYVSQFFRIITDEEINAQALASEYYLGCTHEDEVDTGYNLGKILLEDKGARHIGWTAWRVGDATNLARQEGYKAAVDEWNAANPDDQAELYPLADDKYTSEEARAAVEGLIDTYPEMDSIIVVGGGGMALDGTLAAIAGRDLVGKYSVVSTDFTTNLGEQLANNEIAAMSGGHYADPLFSLIMTYNAIKGTYTRSADEYLEVKFPMLYVASVDDYTAYETYFVNDLPYNSEEILAMANGSFEELQATAASFSIEDVVARHG